MKLLMMTLLPTVFLLGGVDASRILALFPYNAKSHFFMYEKLLKSLAARGHEVVVLGHFPQKKPVPNYKDIDVSGTLPEIINSMPLEMVDSVSCMTFPYVIISEHVDMCQSVLNHTAVKELISSQEKFDLIIAEIFGSDCFLGFVHKFRVPFIGVISSFTFPWSHARIGLPDNPSYIQNYFLPYTDKMSFKERVINTVHGEYMKWMYHQYSDIVTYEIAKKFFGEDLPPLWEIVKNTSLVLSNSYFSVNPPRPTVPGFIEVGGLHVTEAPELPQELQTFINESQDGVVYFSFGSMVPTESMDENKIKSLIDAFSELPQRILWRADPTKLKYIPDNVKASAWLPQNSILGHPNVHAFITHGGLMGTQEAIYSGVPMVMIPLFADQFQNAENCVSKGIAVKLNYGDITKDNVLKALRTVLSPQYQEKASIMSAIFRDRPQTALQSAVFWTEYVIRHRGAQHLRSVAVDLPLYQYLLLDVIGFIASILICFVYIVYLFVMKCLNLFRRSKVHNVNKSKKKN